MDGLLKNRKGFSLIELLVVIAVLVIIMGTAALMTGTSSRDAKVKKAAYAFKSMLLDGLKEAMATSQRVIVEKETDIGQGLRIRMYVDGDENGSYGGSNDRILAYFVVTGDKVDPGRPAGYHGDYYFIPDVVIDTTTQNGGGTLDLTSLYGQGFGAVRIINSGQTKIIIKPEGVFDFLSTGLALHGGGLILFRNVDDVNDNEQDRQYFVLITKTFVRVLKLEDDGTGNYVPKELE